LRALLRHRVALVRLRTLLRNRIHAVLAEHGHDRPGGCWSGPGRAWLTSLQLPATSRELVEDDLGLIDALQTVIDRLDWEIHQRARSDPRVKVLTQLPGVGQFTALVILAEIGDVSRFGSARKLASWAGLTPTVRGSDRVAHYGHISKQGSVWLRWVLCEAAQTAKRHPQFDATFQAIAKRRGKKIATTAVARKLLTRAWHLLTDAERAAAIQPAATNRHPQSAVMLRIPRPQPRAAG
jgi:transposase